MELGNFGACAISKSEPWVTVSEGMFTKDSRQRGAERVSVWPYHQNPRANRRRRSATSTWPAFVTA